ncbi:helix-turn-helix domain-containing protein [Nocardia africana]|uniref:Helix-turn-helix domain-containing protein n=1 Tax=Nocardia africana TaxID=134964 RepID=A0ABW6NMJ0_9NOCA
METLEVLAHPARIRIIHALRGDRTLTTTDLCRVLPDLSKASVYRHVDALVGAGVLEVADERRVRGAVERHYRLHPERAVIDGDTAAAATIDDHRRVFATAMTVLIAEFNAYLSRDDADPAHDPVGYRQHALWLDPAELETLIGDLRKALIPHMANQPTPERARYLISPILFPSAESPSEL